MTLAEGVYAELRRLGVTLSRSHHGLDFRVPDGVEVEELIDLARLYDVDMQHLVCSSIDRKDRGLGFMCTPTPYLNDQGDLVIPFGADQKYHWWAGGQSPSETLRSLGFLKILGGVIPMSHIRSKDRDVTRGENTRSCEAETEKPLPNILRGWVCASSLSDGGGSRAAPIGIGSGGKMAALERLTFDQRTSMRPGRPAIDGGWSRSVLRKKRQMVRDGLGGLRRLKKLLHTVEARDGC